ncbi:MAG TPA: hypothetical protein VF294_15375, partial [Polyangiaceae bacterium]
MILMLTIALRAVSKPETRFNSSARQSHEPLQPRATTLSNSANQSPSAPASTETCQQNKTDKLNRPPRNKAYDLAAAA